MIDFKDFKDLYEHKNTVEASNKVSKNPCVSICVQTYNHKNYIKKCIEGLLMQKTSFSFEILLGEDNSDDGTREICLKYAKTFPEKIRLFLHHRANNIIINNRPTGRFNFLYNYFSANGKYLAFCEGDDYWTDPLKLQKQYDFLNQNKDFVLCFHNVDILKNKNGSHSLSPMHLSLEKDIFETKDILRPWLIPTGSILFRKISDLNFPSWFFSAASGDRPLFLLLSLHGKFKYLNEVMGVYRKHEGGISNFHKGYLKVVSSIFIYQNFNLYTNEKYHKELMEAIKDELYLHLPEFHELKRLRRDKKIKFIEMSRKILKKIS